MEAKFFKSEEDMTIEDVTNALYTASRYFLFPLPLFDILVGKNYREYGLDVLVHNGIIDPKDYSYFEDFDEQKTFLQDIVDKITYKWTTEKKRGPFDTDLFKCYISALILKSDKKVLYYWFTQDLPAIGAVDASVDNSFGADGARLRYKKDFRSVTPTQWTQLKSICV